MNNVTLLSGEGAVGKTIDTLDTAAELEWRLRVLAAIHTGQPEPKRPSPIVATEPNVVTDKPDEFMLEIDHLFAEHVKTAEGLPLPSDANLSRALKLALLLFAPQEDRTC